MLSIRADLIARVCIITAIMSIVSFFVIERHLTTPERLPVTIPFLFVVYGIVVMISILYDLKRYNVTSSK